MSESVQIYASPTGHPGKGDLIPVKCNAAGELVFAGGGTGGASVVLGGYEQATPPVDSSGVMVGGIYYSSPGEVNDGEFARLLTDRAGRVESIVGRIANISASFTRPNDTNAYAAGDLIANNTTAGSVTPMTFASMVRTSGGACAVVKARMSKTGTTLPTSGIKLNLYSALPTVTNGDNGAYLSTGAATFLGTFEFGAATWKAFSDGASCNGITQSGYPVTVDLPSGNDIYGLLESVGVTTPIAQEVFTVTLEVEQE